MKPGDRVRVRNHWRRGSVGTVLDVFPDTNRPVRVMLDRIHVRDGEKAILYFKPEQLEETES